MIDAIRHKHQGTRWTLLGAAWRTKAFGRHIAAVLQPADASRK
jgi:hypothetical protein